MHLLDCEVSLMTDRESSRRGVVLNLNLGRLKPAVDQQSAGCLGFVSIRRVAFTYVSSDLV